MSQVLLFDVEGTTTSIDFVHKTLFPYALARIGDYVRAHSAHPAVQQVRETLQRERGVPASLSDVVAALELWIRADRKHGALKELQGLIWDEGYRAGHFRGHVYPDVRPAFEAWKKQGKTLAIYSSGSVHAQKCIYGFSEVGDLTPLISAHFDTSVGGKREATSYARIAHELRTSPADVTFYSDVKEELDAARAAGMGTVQVFRDGPTQDQGHPASTSFS